MKVLVALSGGVDSSVAAAELLAQGHEVVGITMRLWGGDSDTGCCSVADVDDARRVAQQLDIDHLVFNFTDDFDRDVVDPYVAAHRDGLTPNPCIECNRHLKFHQLLERADVLGFEAVATGHHARIEQHDGSWCIVRGADRAKDQSYVVHMLGQETLARTLFPVGDITKEHVRVLAAEMGLPTGLSASQIDRLVSSVVVEQERSTLTGFSGRVTVNFATADITASGGLDYFITNGTLTFFAGVTNLSVTVAILSDKLVEGNEDFNFILRNPVSIGLGAQTNTVVTILDDDSTLQFSAATATVIESVGSVTLTVTRTGNLNSIVTVPFSTMNASRPV